MTINKIKAANGSTGGCKENTSQTHKNTQKKNYNATSKRNMKSVHFSPSRPLRSNRWLLATAAVCFVLVGELLFRSYSIFDLIDAESVNTPTLTTTATRPENPAPTVSIPERKQQQQQQQQQHLHQAAFDKIAGLQQNQGDVFVAVMTSRKNLSSRVTAIRESWGHLSNIPAKVKVRYFVGKGAGSGSDLMRLAGLEDENELVVMEEVEDDEYPPVYKVTNMLVRAEDIMESMEKENEDLDFDYVMKVDDDTYMNFDGLLKFLANRHIEGEILYDYN